MGRLGGSTRRTSPLRFDYGLTPPKQALELDVQRLTAELKSKDVSLAAARDAAAAAGSRADEAEGRLTTPASNARAASQAESQLAAAVAEV